MRSSPFAEAQPITQAFGERHQRYYSLGLAGHNGVDYGCPLNTDVLAVEAGEVWESAFDPNGYGYYVKLRTEGGSDWLYAHLQHYHMPAPGEWIGEGARVGISGTSGMSTGPHLHLGYRPYWWVRGGPFDGYADPQPLLDNAGI